MLLEKILIIVKKVKIYFESSGPNPFWQSHDVFHASSPLLHLDTLWSCFISKKWPFFPIKWLIKGELHTKFTHGYNSYFSLML